MFLGVAQSPSTFSLIQISLPPMPPGRSLAKYKNLPSAEIEQEPSQNSLLIFLFNKTGFVNSSAINLLMAISPEFFASL